MGRGFALCAWPPLDLDPSGQWYGSNVIVQDRLDPFGGDRGLDLRQGKRRVQALGGEGAADMSFGQIVHGARYAGDVDLLRTLQPRLAIAAGLVRTQFVPFGFRGKNQRLRPETTVSHTHTQLCQTPAPREPGGAAVLVIEGKDGILGYPSTCVDLFISQKSHGPD